MNEPPQRPRRIRKAAQRFDSRPGLVATAEFLRRLLPGDRQYGDTLSTRGDEVPQHLGRLVAELRTERPSAVRELGLGALQAWQALSESQRRGRGAVDLAILFTDLVGSTAKTAALGDRRWRELLEQHHALVRRELARYRGVELDTAGDGFFARFDGPARAIRCACAIRDAIGELGLRVRGEIGESDPNVAIEDALRVFPADEIVISTHPPHRSRWLERRVVERAREEIDLPITHVVVDLTAESAAPASPR